MVSEDRVRKKKDWLKKKDLIFIEIVIVEVSEDTIGKKNLIYQEIFIALVSEDAVQKRKKENKRKRKTQL